MLLNPRLKVLPDGPFIEIDGDSLYLGRDCHLAVHIPALKNRVVSNRHCCVKKERDGGWTLEDLGSTNGTWLMGGRLTDRGALGSGEVFSLGRNGPRLLCELPVLADGGGTLLEEDVAEATTAVDSPDGSAERPFKVGRTPEIVVRHERTGQELSAKGYTVVIGREAAAVQIVIRSDDQKHVSSRHAEVQFHLDGQVMLRDLGSRNGTWLNDRRVQGQVELRVGDRVALGSKVTTLLVERLVT